MKKSPCKAAPGEASAQPERQPLVPQGSKLERGGIGGEIPTQSGLSVEGRPRGGGDPRVAYRSRAVRDDICSKMSCGKVKVICGGCRKIWHHDGSRMICGKGESEMWRLRKI